MSKTFRIAPSILSANFARLGEDVDNVLRSGADIVHFDVMDNHYVPNLTIGPLVCEALKKHGVTAPIDVHLMVKPVDRIIPDFAKAGATVFGVSRDNMKSHDDFKTKLELPFELIADTEEKMCHMFGVVKNKIMYGKKVKGIERSTFLIGPDGTLKQEWRGLKVPGHVEEVLQAVKDLKKAIPA